MPRICLLSDNWPFCDNMISRLSEVNGYEVRQIFNRIFHFIAVERPDYIVSWDNGTDFESLNYEANRLKIRKEDRPWRTIQSLDLEKLVAKRSMEK